MDSVTMHGKPYPAISPLRPELSQKGKTVLVCGGSTGIGHSIARNFCAASASKIIVLGRRPDVLDESVAKLAAAYPETTVVSRPIDIFNRTDAKAMWDEMEGKESIDVVAWNAVSMPALEPILKQGAERVWQDFESNVHMPLYHIERFHRQPGHRKPKYFVYVSTQVIHLWQNAPQMPTYAVTKSAFTATLQQIAKDVPAEELQVLSFHPSTIFTEAAESNGYTRESLPWKDENLPGQFAVWAASPEAAFLHGRFVWCNWDIDELKSGQIRKKIDEDPFYLKVGVKGL